MGNERKVFNADDITRLLASRNITLEAWADELEKTEPKTPKEVWTAWYVFFHAGRDEAACKMYPLWRKLIEAMPNDAYKRRVAAAMFFEPYEPTTKIGVPAKKPVEGRLDVWLTGCETLGVFYCPQYPTSRLQKEGWDNEKITAWMKQRVRDVWEYKEFPKPMPTSSGRPSYRVDTPIFRWQEELLGYLRFIQYDRTRRYEDEKRRQSYDENDTREIPEPEKPFQEELNRLNEDAKKHPGDWQKMAFLMHALTLRVDVKDRPDLSWIAATAPKFSVPESFCLTGYFQSFGCSDIAEPFYRRALTEPLTAEESENLWPKSMRGKSEGRDGGMGGDRYGGRPYEITEEHVQAMFRVTVIDQFCAFLKSQNREEELDTLREERKRLAKEYHIFHEARMRTPPRYEFVSPEYDPEARNLPERKPLTDPNDPKY